MDLEIATREWDAVPTIVPKFNTTDEGVINDVERPLNLWTTTEEAVYYLRKQELSFYMGEIEPFVVKKGLSKIFSRFFGYPKLSATLESDRNEIFAIAHCQLEPNNEFHARMLRTVYRGFTGLHVECPRYGRHWEQVGFQGSNPDTDLRGVGLMGLLHLVHLAANPQLSPLARAVYCASQDFHHGFPLAVLSLNLSKSTLQALREGVLNRECNQRMSVMKVVLQYHAALFSITLRLWQTKQCTLKDAAYIIKKAENDCKKDVEHSISMLYDHIRKLSLPERCSPRARFAQAACLHQLASQARSEFFI